MRAIDKLLFILIIMVIILLSVMIYRYDKDASECMENPMQFGVNYLAKLNVANITCMCYADKPEIENGIFTNNK